MVASYDDDLLKQFCSLLGGSIAPKKVGNSTKLRFKSDIMANKLRALGMDVKKKVRKTHDKVPGNLQWDFARGCFDADGTITEDRIQFDTENKALVKFMVKMMKKVVGDSVKYYEYGNMGKMVVTGSDANKCVSKIYSGGGPRSGRKSKKKITKISKKEAEKK